MSRSRARDCGIVLVQLTAGPFLPPMRPTYAQPLFQKIAGRAANPNPSLAISWDFIDCSPYVNTTIKMLVKPGGSAYYQVGQEVLGFRA